MKLNIGLIALGTAGLALLFSAIALVSIPTQTGDGDRLAVMGQRLAAQRAQSDELEARIDKLEEALASISGVEHSPMVQAPRSTGDLGGYGTLMRLVNRRDTNESLRPVSTGRLLEVFGEPSEELDNKDCAKPTSPALIAALATQDVGPFRARMIKPALASLKEIFSRVRLDEPLLYEQLVPYGGLCARLIRGSEDMISRHAFGVAIDISIGDTLDQMGDGKTQRGLILLADYFNEAGWVWGAAFGREDSMHFEVSDALFNQWYK